MGTRRTRTRRGAASASGPRCGENLGNAIKVGLGEAGVERQREGPLVARLGAREVPLVAIRAQAVDGIRADLRLDPGFAERFQRPVAAVELHDVRLPAVAVSLLRRRRLDDP